MFKITGAAVAGASLLGLEACASEDGAGAAGKRGKKKILVIGAHPDDPENWYDEEHGRMDEFRGMQYNVKYGEAFVRFHRTVAKGSVLDL